MCQVEWRMKVAEEGSMGSLLYCDEGLFMRVHALTSQCSKGSHRRPLPPFCPSDSLLRWKSAIIERREKDWAYGLWTEIDTVFTADYVCIQAKKTFRSVSPEIHRGSWAGSAEQISFVGYFKHPSIGWRATGRPSIRRFHSLVSMDAFH